jgi:3-oxoacyl-[acyl-carrier protein] reductase
MADLRGKTAVVTGGSRGIGRAIVERLASDGATVVFGYHSRDDQAREVEKAAPGSRAVRADLGRSGAVERLFEGVDELDILVNNAAAPFTPAPISEITDDEYDRVMTTNAKAVFRALRHAARHMRRSGLTLFTGTATRKEPCEQRT